MSEHDNGAAAGGETAGALIRQARQAQGLHLAALAAMIKVTPRKLEALEADRYDELPDATFTRALAQAVCRALKIDATPVLSRLPASGVGNRLEQVGGSINQPMRSRGVRHDGGEPSRVTRPMMLAGGLLLLAALIYFLPANLMPSWTASPGAASAPVLPPTAASGVITTPIPTPLPAPAPVAPSAPVGPGAASAVPVPSASLSPSSPPASAPAVAALAPAPAAAVPPPTASAAGGAAAPAAPAATGLLRIATRAPSWVEVQDGSGKVQLARTVQTGESLSFDGPLPLRLKVGNAAGTEVSFRGQPVPMTSRDNVVRLELK